MFWHFKLVVCGILALQPWRAELLPHSCTRNFSFLTDLYQKCVRVRIAMKDVDAGAVVLQRAMLPGINSGLVEVVQGDVFQYATLPKALGDANAIICSTGASEITDPFSPFNVSHAQPSTDAGKCYPCRIHLEKGCSAAKQTCTVPSKHKTLSIQSRSLSMLGY
jgi:hypothetical protein